MISRDQYCGSNRDSSFRVTKGRHIGEGSTGGRVKGLVISCSIAYVVRRCAFFDANYLTICELCDD